MAKLPIVALISLALSITGCSKENELATFEFCKLAKKQVGTVGQEIQVEGALIGDFHHSISLVGKNCDERIDLDFQDWDVLRPQMLETVAKEPSGHITVLKLVGSLDEYPKMDNNPENWVLRVENINSVKEVSYAPIDDVLHQKFLEKSAPEKQ
ncbi:hypothetical protein [Parasphingorhabdus sp.]|uniref:hypothetical protein n=1 Tax=Parasphingorhabdus sp. TaxID=2709688 RepID=UPI003BAF4670